MNVLRRGDLWWADLNDPVGSSPGYRRPVLIVQADEFNDRALNTVIVGPLTTQLALARHTGNLLLTAKETGLGRDSVLVGPNVGVVDRSLLTDRIGSVPAAVLAEVDVILGLVLDLQLQ